MLGMSSACPGGRSPSGPTLWLRKSPTHTHCRRCRASEEAAAAAAVVGKKYPLVKLRKKKKEKNPFPVYLKKKFKKYLLQVSNKVPRIR